MRYINEYPLQTIGTVLVSGDVHQYLTAMDHATALDLFKFYSNEMSEVQTNYIGLILTITAGLITLIIWFLTSDKPYRIFARIKYARNIFWGCLFLLALVEGRVILMLLSTARSIQSAISTVVPQMDVHLGISFYTYKKMSLEMAIWFYSLHFLMYATVAFLIWRSKKITSLSATEIPKKRTKVQIAA